LRSRLDTVIFAVPFIAPVHRTGTRRPRRANVLRVTRELMLPSRKEAGVKLAGGIGFSGVSGAGCGVAEPTVNSSVFFSSTLPAASIERTSTVWGPRPSTRNGAGAVTPPALRSSTVMLRYCITSTSSWFWRPM
jgi:hypothetical protein